ncbi:hypothetical protein DN412_32075 [Cupriavidus lacunae]|uniref:Uncharacterized protein n=1 Tax=Cupriavidus lacunae TaxID=2666307 RepID=A0A370NL38_9BURK|nr:hypothetical protein DN412_32075 [Cupriavidus lacunae]
MCFRIHYLDRLRENAAQQRHDSTTLLLRSRFDERRAALMAWLRMFPKPTSPGTATSLEQAEPAEAAARPVPLPIDQACTVASTASEREAEAA